MSVARHGPLIVGYDGGDCAKAALAEAIRLAEPLRAEIVLVSGAHVQRTGSEVADFAAVVRERAQGVLEEGLEAARAAGVHVRGEIVEQRVADGLTELGERESAQMIVVGSHGERPLRGALLGSTPHRLLQQSETPVLVVRA